MGLCLNLYEAQELQQQRRTFPKSILKMLQQGFNKLMKFLAHSKLNKAGVWLLFAFLSCDFKSHTIGKDVLLLLLLSYQKPIG